MGEFTIPGMMKITTVKKPARKARKGINPFTGEETVFKAKPASVAVKVVHVVEDYPEDMREWWNVRNPLTLHNKILRDRLEFVDRIVGGQMQAGQFLNADITFKDIETVKKVLKQRLTNIYHLRVEYPE